MTRWIERLLARFGSEVNLNHMAERVTEAEGQKQSISIAQVKEVQRLVLWELSQLNLPTLTALMRRIRNS